MEEWLKHNIEKEQTRNRRDKKLHKKYEDRVHKLQKRYKGRPEELEEAILDLQEEMYGL